MGPDDHMQEWSVADPSVFPTSLIACSLLTLERSPKLEGILNKIGSHLQYQMMRGGVWNHFTEKNEFWFRICPPDADNSVIAAKVLDLLNLAHPNNLPLLLENRSSKGLFYTWFVLRPRLSFNKTYLRIMLRELKYPIKSLFFWIKNECGRNDIDAAVNANVLFFLGFNSYTQPIVSYLIDIIKNNQEHDCDKWYRNPFTIYYFISRNFNRGIEQLDTIKSTIIERILNHAKPSGGIGDSYQDTALGILSLIHAGFSGHKLRDAVKHLLSGQLDYGCWPRHILYYSGPSKVVGWGSEELTTGFCIEALNAYKNLTANCRDL